MLTHFERVMSPRFRALYERVLAQLTSPEMARDCAEMKRHLFSERLPAIEAAPPEERDALRLVVDDESAAGAWAVEASRRVEEILSRNPSIEVDPTFAGSLACSLAVVVARARALGCDVCDWDAINSDSAVQLYFYELEPHRMRLMLSARGAGHLFRLDAAKATQAFALRMAHTLACFDAGHRQTYRVTEGLAQRMMLTELRGIRGTDVRMPYKSIYVEVPPSLKYHVTSPDEQKYVLHGVYLLERPAPAFVDDDDERPEGELADDDNRRLLIVLCGLPVGAPENSIDDAVEYVEIGLNDTPVTEEVARVSRDARLTTESLGLYRDGRPARIPRLGATETSHWPAIINWAVNVLFYMTRPFAELLITDDNREYADLERRALAAPKGSQKRQGLYQRLRGLTSRRRTVLGGGITVDRSLPVDHAGAVAAFGGTGIPRTTRQEVAGHYQRYAVGPGSRRVGGERQWKYVGPYKIGPENAPLRAPEHRLRRRADDKGK